MLKEHYKVYEEKMKKSVEAVERDFGAVRAGRANASVLNRIQVDYYGTPTPIQQIAAVASPDPRTLLITPWDASALKGIEKAIQESDLGINPQNDGKSIRLAFPQLTEERRKDLVKQIRKYNEGGKVAIRNIRRDAMEAFGVMSLAPLKRWCALYREGGAEALRPKPRGRHKGSKSRPRGPTREQELEREVRRLEAQVAYLKKSIALKAEKRSRTERKRLS